jgi:hypothetical protein
MNKYPDHNFDQYDDNETIKERLKEAVEDHKKAKEQAHELRQAFLEEQAEIAKQNGNLGKYKTLKQQDTISQS